MTTFVLVAGAWLGGWAWQPVARRLRASGHDVHPVTLTGLGERSHLARPEVDLGTHVADVANLIEFEDLHDVVLVAHSYAMFPVTGVADRVPERLSLVAYLESGPVPDGRAYVDFLPPPAGRLVDRLVQRAGDGWQVPLPSWEELGEGMGTSLEGLGPESGTGCGAEPPPSRCAPGPSPCRWATRPARSSPSC
jgi:pimeloyl-ACP methyl ester carboxylesterase